MQSKRAFVTHAQRRWSQTWQWPSQKRASSPILVSVASTIRSKQIAQVHVAVGFPLGRPWPRLGWLLGWSWANAFLGGLPLPRLTGSGAGSVVEASASFLSTEEGASKLPTGKAGRRISLCDLSFSFSLTGVGRTYAGGCNFFNGCNFFGGIFLISSSKWIVVDGKIKIYPFSNFW